VSSITQAAASLLGSEVGVEYQATWFAFVQLAIETAAEKELRERIGHYLVLRPLVAVTELASPAGSRAGPRAWAAGNLLRVRAPSLPPPPSLSGRAKPHAHGRPAAEVSLEKPLDRFAVFRWAQYCLATSAHHPLCPLYWQRLLSLVFAKSSLRGAGVNNPFYGFRFLSAKPGLRDELKARLVELARIHRSAATSALAAASAARHARRRRRLAPPRRLRVWRSPLDRPRLSASLHILLDQVAGRPGCPFCL
jgi:hypothetical protein